MPPASVPPQYFSEQKRGEINELKQLMRLVQSERMDNQKQRDALKKVIAYMTLGIDVSQLFSEIIMACCTNDIVQKKMVYLYLGTYAETNPELALLAVNTLQKDSTDNDPAIRGLALRSLCSLRSPTVVEYLEPAIRRSLVDPSGYVRRTAAMGVLKLFHLNPALVTGREMVIETEEEINRACDRIPENLDSLTLLQFLFKMLNDVDPQVVINVIHILNEILANKGGLPFTRSLIIRLLNRIRQFNDWGQCAILNLLAEYKPANDTEMFDILNILEERLKHCSSAVVLAATRSFFSLTADRKDLHASILARLKSPLVTLVTTACPEIGYVVLVHLHHLLVALNDNKENEGDLLSTKIMEGDTKLFYCAYTDPVYVKLAKLDILGLITSQTTAPSVLDELSEYVIADVESSVVRKSIEVMGQLGSRYTSLAEGIMSQLQTFLDLDVPFITAPVLNATRTFLRSQPELFHIVEKSIPKHFAAMTDQESIAAALWILGTFGDRIHSAPYLLEEYIAKLESSDGDVDSNQKPTRNLIDFESVLVELITACMKVFFHRAPEMQPVLGRLFQLVLQDDSVSQDVRDRALQFYRFLGEANENPSVANLLKRILEVNEEDSDILDIFDTSILNNEINGKGFASTDFNSLALLFKMPPAKFLAVKTPIPFSGRYISQHHKSETMSLYNKEACETRKYTTDDGEDSSSTADLLGIHEQPQQGTTTTIVKKPHSSSTRKSDDDDDDDDDGFLSFGEMNSKETNNLKYGQVNTSIASTTTDEPISFLPGESIPPVTFENNWRNLTDAIKVSIRLRNPIPTVLHENDKKQETTELLNQLQYVFMQCNLTVVASGVPTSNTLKCFLYGKTRPLASPCFFEVDVNTNHNIGTITIKSTAQDPQQILHCLLAQPEIVQFLVLQ